MYPVQSFIRHSGECANDVILASQKEDQGKLRQRDIASPIADVLEVQEVVQVHVKEAKDCDQYKMSEDDYERPNSWQRQCKATES